MGKQYANRLRDLRNDPQLIVFYAKENCKKCYGRGYQRYSHPTLGDKLVFCKCVEKNVRKETDELEEAIAAADKEDNGAHSDVDRPREDKPRRTSFLGRRNDGHGPQGKGT